MQRIQPGHEVISLFGVESHSQALNKKIVTHGNLIVNLISAFFIVLAVSLILGLSTRILGMPKSSVAASSIQAEKVAFTPGQFVSKEISQGYLGNYR